VRIFACIIIVLVVILCVGCQQIHLEEAPLDLISSPSVIQLPASPIQAIQTPGRIDLTMTKIPERVPPTVEITPVTGEVPTKLLGSILEDLSGRTGAAMEKISVIQAQSVVWNDGSLGCPQPGVMYTQALVPGFQVVLEAGSQRYDYHASETGYFTLCESGIPPIFPSGTPKS